MTIQIIPSHPTSDGAGVKIQRIHGFQQNQLDPFLMLDEIRSNNPDDYGSGFPAHPHRGIETLTYMRHGGFVHEDHLGNKGTIQSGEAQWMSAGRGIIHSEIPLQQDGLMHGFQLWINLPAKHKMKPADWQDISCEQLPWQPLTKAELKVIAGQYVIVDAPGSDKTTSSQTFSGPLQQLPSAAAVADLCLKPDGEICLETSIKRTLLVYVYEGELSLNGQPLTSQQMAKLQSADTLQIRSAKGAGALLLSGQPLNEPVAHYGPFVMNTQAEIDQAIRAYQQGTLTD
ncbi:pirin family protein [Amphritea sp. 1_MG-2023]|uniref:pirin family protein n=1 Tax=Amphritea sp. 1_MG-2023 TaxID=3062670 RepID=UPI0026E2BCCD|nr:pirin family protein [Amphritea sp. 1_MG-2023]MDO6562042.1 pirin family protein [Amphritea sp. 1_MG-2023]